MNAERAHRANAVTAALPATPATELTDALNGAGFTGPDELEAGELWFKWKLYTLRDAYQERPPVRYLVEGLLPCPSLCIVYGGPGSLKSMLLADLCVCVASGERWLEPIPGAKSKGVSFATFPAPVMWIDYDNGIQRTHERFDAFGKGRGLPDSLPLYYASMALPWLDASRHPAMEELAKLMRHLGVRLLVIDNLGLISGDVEENSGDMTTVMGNLRWLCESTESVVIVVHHQRKSAGASDRGIRKGETLRGHSSIEAALDLALLVERKEGSDTIAVIPTKVRGYRQHDFFGAHFTYEHKPGGTELQSARFFCHEALTAEEAAILKIKHTIHNILIAESPMSQKDLVAEVRDRLAAEPGGKAPGINLVRGILKAMAQDGEIDEAGSRGGGRMYGRI